jgi:hypothetical protein
MLHKPIDAMHNLCQQVGRGIHKRGMVIQAAGQHLLRHMQPPQVAELEAGPSSNAPANPIPAPLKQDTRSRRTITGRQQHS